MLTVSRTIFGMNNDLIELFIIAIQSTFIIKELIYELLNCLGIAI